MSFPGGLSPRVDLYYSNVWNDVTADTLARDQENSITISRGRASEDSSITPATANLSFRNADGKYSPRNANSPLYGLIGRNTPIRVGVGVPPVAAAVSTSTSSSNLIAPSVTAEVTGVLIEAWIAAPAGDVTLPGGFTAGTELDGNLTTYGSGFKASVAPGATGTQTATFSVTATAQATMSVHVPGGTFSSSTANRALSGADINLTPTASAGQTIIAVCGWSDDPDDRMQPPKVQGDRGLGWVMLADSGSATVGTPRVAAWALTVSGSTGIISLVGKRDSTSDAFMRLYTVTGVSTYIPRFVGEIAEFPVQWTERGKDVWAPVQAAGITRRLGAANQASMRSAIYESFIRRSSTVGYWPFEDDAGAAAFSSALTGGAPAAFVNTPVPAAYGDIVASDPIPTFTGAAAICPIGPITNTGSYAFGCIVHVDAAGDTVGANILSLDFNGGDIQSVVLEYAGAALINLKILYSDGTASFTSPEAHQMDGNTFSVTAAVLQSGADIVWAFSIADITTDGSVPIPLSIQAGVVGKVIGAPIRLNVGLETGTGATLHTNATAIGHVFLTNDATVGVFNYADPDLSAISYKALIAWNNQKISDRIFRLCCDSRVRVNVAHLDTDEQLGNQMPNTLLGDLQEAENTSAGGVVYDSAGFLGISYRGRISKESQTPSLTLDYAAHQIGAPFLPVDDDQRTENDVTVNRVGGASGRAVLASGSLSVQPFPNGVGPYRQTYDLSLFLDSRTAAQAQWRIHLGTIDEARWPSVTVDLGAPANTSVPAALAMLDLGDTVRLTNLPAWAPPGPVDLILEGYTENIGSYRWIFTGNYSSATGFRVNVLDDAVFGRLDAAAAHLQASANSTQTALLVNSLDSTVWTTTATRPGDFPFDITVSGERMTVTAITGTVNQTFTVVRSINGVVKTHNAGEPVRLAQPTYLGM